MGSLWNAAAAALAGHDTLDRFARQTARAPDAIARAARPLVEAGAGRPLTLVTWSASSPVKRLFETLAAAGPLSVRCAEARPALEGRSLAAAVARAGARVEVFADGALAAALDGAAAVVVGADAVTAEWFVNKAGTRALALAAAAGGVPTYVLAGRDKGLGPELARHLQLREGPAAEIWARRPRGVKARNPYFERVPWLDVAALVSDRGVVGAADVGRAGERRVEDGGLREERPVAVVEGPGEPAQVVDELGPGEAGRGGSGSSRRRRSVTLKPSSGSAAVTGASLAHSETLAV